jgi:hypothetical protein
MDGSAKPDRAESDDKTPVNPLRPSDPLELSTPSSSGLRRRLAEAVPATEVARNRSGRARVQRQLSAIPELLVADDVRSEVVEVRAVQRERFPDPHPGDDQ